MSRGETGSDFFQVAKFHFWKILLKNHQKSVLFSPSSAMFL